jgi:SAM-dependent methyltransferase
MSLTPTPPGNRVLRKQELDRDKTRYPLDLYCCEDCHHVQLGYVVDPEILYQDDYSYVSGTSAHFIKHLEQYASEMTRRFNLQPGALVADIGSNDGTCLRFFQEAGMRVVGVDPAPNIARAATNAGIETVNDFFSESLAVQLRERFGPAALVTSHNACAHIDELDAVVRGVAHWLDDGGVFVLEVGYFVDVYQKLHFDTIYHEHLDYHTVGPFERLFARTGMELISVQRIEPQGGSIRVMAQKAGGPLKQDSSVAELIELEAALGLTSASTLKAFGDRIAGLGDELRALIGSVKNAGKRIAAYGAPTKATTLLSHFGIGAESLDFVVDDNPLKQGMYLPISHLPILPTSELYSRRPDFLLILAWNFAEPIMSMHRRYVDEGGRFILPMPNPGIVGENS